VTADVVATRIDEGDKSARLARAQIIGRIKGLRVGASLFTGAIGAVIGLVLWVIGHMAAVWAAKRDPSFVDVVRRHVRFPLYFGT